LKLQYETIAAIYIRGVIWTPVFSSIRLVNVSMPPEQFWAGPIFQNAVEMALSILITYALNGIMQSSITGFNRRKGNYSLSIVE
jgi:hypothetical protein